MSNIWKRSLSLLLAMVMVMGTVPMGALAAETEDFVCEDPNAEIVETFEEGAAPEDSGEDNGEEIAAAEQETVPVSEPEKELEGQTITGITETTSDPVALAVVDEVPEGATQGLIWLDSGNKEALLSEVMQGGLKKLVLTAVGGTYSDDAVVEYDGMDVSNVMILLTSGLANSIYDAIRAEKILTFTVRDGSVAEEVYISCRDLRSSNAKITLTVKDNGVISGKQKPADLESKIQEIMDSVDYQITYAGEDMKALSEIYVDDSGLDGDGLDISSVIWPEDSKGKKLVSLKVTLWDALGVYSKTDSVDLMLQDTTMLFTVIYEVDGIPVDVHNNFAVDDLNNITNANVPKTEYNPVRDHSTFNGWKQPVVDVANREITLVPDWDSDTYTVTFDYNYPAELSEEVKEQLPENKTYPNVAWGTQLSEIDEPEVPDLAAYGYKFAGWNKPSSRVTNDMTIQAVWYKEKAGSHTVTYHLIDGEFFVQSTGEDGKAVYVSYDDTDTDCVVWKGWHKVSGKDANNNPIPGELYQFDEVLEDDTLELVGVWLDDVNNNGTPDGTAEDPFVEFTYMQMIIDKVTYEHTGKYNITQKVTLQGDDAKAFYENGLDAYTGHPAKYPDVAQDIYIFKNWRVEEVGGNEFGKSYKCYPEFEAEVNHNKVADSKEQIVLVRSDNLENPGTVLVDGREAVDGKFTRDSKNGSEIEVKLNGSAVVTAIALEPVTSTASLYGDEDLPEGAKPLNLVYSDDHTTVTAQMDAYEGDQYVLHVYFRDAHTFELKKPHGELSLARDGGFTDEEVYNATVNFPAYKEDAVTVKYLARKAMSGKVSVQSLYNVFKTYEDMAPFGWTVLADYLGLVEEKGVWYYTYNLDEKWETLDYQLEGGVMYSPEEVLENYVTELSAITDVTKITQMVNNMFAELDALEKKLDASAIHPFGYNPTGEKSVVETVDIVYEDAMQKITLEKPIAVTLNDPRTKTTLSAPKTMTFTYNELSSRSKVIEKLTLTGDGASKSDIKLSMEDIAEKNVGTYKVTAVYPENKSFTRSEVSFTVIITQNPAPKVIMDPAVLYMDRFVYDDVKAKTDPKGVALMHIIAGWDMQDSQLDADFNPDLSNPSATFSGLKGKAWIDAPKDVLDLLQTAMEHEGYAVPGNLSLAQATELIGKYRSALEKKVDSGVVDMLLDFLNKASAYVSADMDIVLGAPSNVNAGIYMNLAITADTNYKTGYAVGAIVISPVVGLPNRGGVQLTYDGKPENVFVLVNDGSKKEMTVTLNGKVQDADVYYYGLTATTSAYNSTTAPSAPGIYVATTIVVDQNNRRVGSDSVVLLIGLDESSIDVERKVAPYTGKEIKPGYVITNKRTGKTTTSADITMISAAVDVDTDITYGENGADVSLKSVTGTVTIDLPAWIGRKWEEFRDSEIAKQFNITGTFPYTVTKATVIRFLDWCIDHVDAPANELEKYGVTHRYIDAVTDKTEAVFNHIKTKINEIPGGDSVKMIVKSVGRNQYTGYTEKGTYLYLGIVTDSDYVPSANPGMLIIGEEDDLILWNSWHPFDGNGHEPVSYNATGRDGLMIYYDYDHMYNGIPVPKSNITFLVDDDLQAAIEKYIEQKFDINVVPGTINIDTLIGKGVNWADDTADAIIEALAERAKFELPKRLGNEIDWAARLTVEAKDRLKAYLSDKLEAMAQWHNVGQRTISVKPYKADMTNHPKNMGDYHFVSFSYGMVYDAASLHIVPNRFTVHPADATKVYLDKDPDFKTEDIIAEFYGKTTYKYEANGEWHVTTDDYYPVDGYELSDIGLDLSKVKIVREAGEDVDTYTLSLENAPSGQTFFDGTLIQDASTTGIFTITPKPITVNVVADDVYYDYTGEYPDVTYEYTEELKEGAKLTYTLTYNKSGALGAQELSIVGGPVMDGDLITNYDITVNSGTITIKPAEIVLDLKDITRLSVENTVDQLRSALPEYYAVKESNGNINLEDSEVISAIADAILSAIEDGYKNAEGKLQPGDFEIAIANTTIDSGDGKYKITFANDAVLKVDVLDYVCWNTRTGKYYEVVQLAILEAAENGDTVEMLRDSDQREKTHLLPTSGTINIYYGVTLDLASYKLTADYVFGVNGAYLTADPNSGKLDVDKGHLILGKEAPKVRSGNTNYDVLPIWKPVSENSDDGDYYLFSLFGVNADPSKSRGLEIAVDADPEYIYFQFKHQATAAINQSLLSDGDGDNALRVIVRLTWTMYDVDENNNKIAKGTATQDFDYNDFMVGKTTGSYDYNYKLNNFSLMDVDLDTLEVSAMVISDSGVICKGEIHKYVPKENA